MLRGIWKENVVIDESMGFKDRGDTESKVSLKHEVLVSLRCDWKFRVRKI